MKYVHTTDSILPEQLGPSPHGDFFDGWPNPPSPENHLRLLQGSAHVVLAIDEETNQVVGFINAISDGALCAYIPLLEVRIAYKGRGIGTELTRRMIDQLQHLYAIDLLCDEDVQPFYARLGMQPTTGMLIRNYARQSAEPT